MCVLMFVLFFSESTLMDVRLTCGLALPLVFKSFSEHHKVVIQVGHAMHKQPRNEHKQFCPYN